MAENIINTTTGNAQDNAEGRVQARPRFGSGWWATFVAISLIGFSVAFTGFRHGLPYIDFPDEVTIWTMGHATFDPSWPMFQPQYPPGLLAISSAIQRIEIAGGNPFLDPSATIETMRFTSVCAF